jgi:hypothetical protein
MTDEPLAWDLGPMSWKGLWRRDVRGNAWGSRLEIRRPLPFRGLGDLLHSGRRGSSVACVLPVRRLDRETPMTSSIKTMVYATVTISAFLGYAATATAGRFHADGNNCDGVASSGSVVCDHRNGQGEALGVTETGNPE